MAQHELVQQFEDRITEFQTIIAELREWAILYATQRNDFLRLAAEFAADDLGHLLAFQEVLATHRARLVPEGEETAWAALVAGHA